MADKLRHLTYISRVLSYLDVALTSEPFEVQRVLFTDSESLGDLAKYCHSLTKRALAESSSCEPLSLGLSAIKRH